MPTYKVTFTSGSTDLIDAESAADARDQARADFGGRVKTVEVQEGLDEEDEEDEEEEDEEDEDEGQDEDEDTEADE